MNIAIVKIAIFKSIDYDTENVADESFEGVDGYIRISEYSHIDFIRLPESDVAVKEVEILRETKKKIQAETELKLNEVDRKIGELLALPNFK